MTSTILIAVIIIGFQRSARASGLTRGGASYTFGALAILVVAPGKKPSRVKVPEACRSPPFAAPPRAVGGIKWLPGRSGEAGRWGLGLAPGGALSQRGERGAAPPLPARRREALAGCGVLGRKGRRPVVVLGY